MHSEAELVNKLKMRNAAREDIDDVIDFLKECGFINDHDFASDYAAELRDRKKYGKNRIKSELYKKGIDPGIISEILENTEFDRDDLYPLAEAKLNGDFSKKNVDRTVRYFNYRGYDISDIISCINDIRESGDSSEISDELRYDGEDCF
ncbi:MAG: regulatory protein RecX [Oscillospiraceae bacterium]|nr:regulatory protein RecX [Oscillospiraceae bacterium]